MIEKMVFNPCVRYVILRLSGGEDNVTNMIRNTKFGHSTLFHKVTFLTEIGIIEPVPTDRKRRTKNYRLTEAGKQLSELAAKYE